MTDWPGWLPKTFFGVDMDVLGACLTTSVVTAGFVGWVRDLPRSRFLQSVVAAIIMAPGTAVFCMQQFSLPSHWAFMIGTAVGLCALPFMLNASRKAPLAMDMAINEAVDAARRMLNRGGVPPPADKGDKP